MKTYKCFDENNANYWIERIRANEPMIDLFFTQHYNNLQDSANIICEDCPLLDEISA